MFSSISAELADKKQQEVLQIEELKPKVPIHPIDIPVQPVEVISSILGLETNPRIRVIEPSRASGTSVFTDVSKVGLIECPINICILILLLSSAIHSKYAVWFQNNLRAFLY